MVISLRFRFIISQAFIPGSTGEGKKPKADKSRSHVKKKGRAMAASRALSPSRSVRWRSGWGMDVFCSARSWPPSSLTYWKNWIFLNLRRSGRSIWRG